MSVQTKTVYTCDLCHCDLAGNALPRDWIEVQTPWPGGQIAKHVCSGCRARIYQAEPAP